LTYVLPRIAVKQFGQHRSVENQLDTSTHYKAEEQHEA